MFVIKRNGRQERVQFDKITSRITKLAYNLNTQFVDPGACALRLGMPAVCAIGGVFLHRRLKYSC